jgi:hypothetical protein
MFGFGDGLKLLAGRPWRSGTPLTMTLGHRMQGSAIELAFEQGVQLSALAASDAGFRISTVKIYITYH